jgi:4-amino-4-deoxy-L-arabinose transferase-like glycosyltransferase
MASNSTAVASGTNDASSGRTVRGAPLLLLVVVLAAFTWNRLSIAAVPSEREYDEGVYLCSARAVAAGYDLFTDVFSSQPPAIVETLALTLRTFGDNLFVARTFILAFALVSILAVARIASQMAGPWAGPAAACALALSMTFGDLAHVVVAETPALALALASMAACLESRRRGWSRTWLVAAGALLALAALYKLIVVPLAIPLGMLLLLAPAGGEESDWRLDRRIKDVIVRGLLVAAAGCSVLAIPLLLYDAGAMFDQLIGFHLEKHGVFAWSVLSNLDRTAGHLRADATMTAAAVAGVLVLAFRGRLLAATWLTLWAGAMVLAMAVQTPLFWRHFVLISPPLAIAAGVLAASLARGRPLATGAIVLAAIGVWTGATLYNSRGMFPLLSDGTKNDRTFEALEKSALWIQSNTRPDELVGSDEQIGVYLAGRQSPPGLCDTSTARIVSESLQVEEAARASVTARVIVLRKGGRLSSLPGYVGWLKKNYDVRPAALTGLGTSRIVWIRREGATAQATNPFSLRDRGEPAASESPNGFVQRANRPRDDGDAAGLRPPPAEAPGN